MTQLDNGLVRCFSAIFPALTEEEIRSVDLELSPDMDSLAGVTLLALIDQEFGIALDLEELLALRTFDSVQRYVDERHGQSLRSKEQMIK